jgi:adenylate cyclase
VFVFSQQDNRPVLGAFGESLRSPGPFPVVTNLTVGAADYCDVQVFKRNLTDCHARLVLDGGKVYIEDLSKGGTFVNGLPITRSILNSGDQLQFRPAPEQPKVEEPAESRTEISRESIPWAPVEQLVDLCTEDKTQWISPTLRLQGTSAVNHEVRLQALLSISTTLSRSHKLENQMQEVTDFVVRTMNIDRAMLFLVDPTSPKSGTFSYRAQSSRSGNPGEEPSHTVITKVVDSEEGLLIRDAQLDSKMAQSASIRIQKIRTCICLPLKTQQNLLGVLYADANRPNILNEKDDVQFFSAFASLAAVAVENSLLLRKVEKQVAERARYQRFFPPQAIDHLMDSDALLAGREQDVTILFCDIRNYTALSAQRSAKQVAELLNHYFKTLVPIIFARQGTLEKFIGDALVAIWGAPLEMPAAEQLSLALQAGLEIQKGIQELNARVPGLELEAGIGVHHGPAYVGALGDDSYLQYAAVGSTTNLSARICGHAKARQVLMSRESYQILANTGHQPAIAELLKQIRHVGTFLAKGLSEEVELYEIEDLETLSASRG